MTPNSATAKPIATALGSPIRFFLSEEATDQRKHPWREFVPAYPGKSHQIPPIQRLWGACANRSRKSAMDLFKAGVIVLTPLSSVGKTEWDYLHKCRVVVQRNGITRTRPALKAGWEVEFDIQINLPEYIEPSILNEVIANAGRLLGIGDFRPTYGQFQVTKFSVQ